MRTIDDPGRTRREAILAAAAGLVRERGAAHLTLDAVSARARVSKGGLLYHFRTKESLLAAMVARLSDALSSVQEREAAKLASSPGATLKAQVRAMEMIRHRDIRPIAAALLAAGAHDPRLLKPARKARKTAMKDMESGGMSSTFIRIVICAMEGLLLSEMLGLSVHSPVEYRAFMKYLLRLIDQEEARL